MVARREAVCRTWRIVGLNLELPRLLMYLDPSNMVSKRVEVEGSIWILAVGREFWV